ncbi:hypothetical protein GYMLUDRAFT_252838 [Collybiopsis luxurians FD-317 M1]|uniref:Acetyl-CoA hydrolase/transferase C-terminal domain-containing protein n=1 Tax=Collybiopsis luxurians FD-317 M1 TaxID=944289 RepID=A0A0D0B8V2_9AGAR|nr:hypothetical protein GYMLUDRAFT_252838 [Collybiopsis luxurians FD-317 M1]
MSFKILYAILFALANAESVLAHTALKGAELHLPKTPPPAVSQFNKYLIQSQDGPKQLSEAGKVYSTLLSKLHSAAVSEVISSIPSIPSPLDVVAHPCFALICQIVIYEIYPMKLEKQLASSPEIIRRMGIKAMLVDISGHANSTNAPGSNTPLVCIFGPANSTNELGLRMLNWLGVPGSADFLRDAKDFDYAYTVYMSCGLFLLKDDPTGISCIEPFASQVDQTEHGLDVVIERGLADFRGLSPRKRSKVIIEKCTHPDYKDLF